MWHMSYQGRQCKLDFSAEPDSRCYNGVCGSSFSVPILLRRMPVVDCQI